MTLDEVALLQPGAVVPELQHRRVDVGDGYWRCERCQRLEGRRYLHALEVCPTAAMEVVKERDAYRKAKQENDERFMLERDEARHERDELRLTLAAEQGRAEGAPFSSSPRLRAAVNAERIRQGLSWRGLAARIGVSSSGFTRWNAGHELSVPAYLKVCDWLRSAMLAADAATAPCAGPAPASTASPPTGT